MRSRPTWLKPRALNAGVGLQDEGEFWKSRNEALLKSHIEKVNGMIEEIRMEHPNAKGPIRLPGGRIVDVTT